MGDPFGSINLALSNNLERDFLLKFLLETKL